MYTYLKYFNSMNIMQMWKIVGQQFQASINTMKKLLWIQNIFSCFNKHLVGHPSRRNYKTGATCLRSARLAIRDYTQPRFMECDSAIILQTLVKLTVIISCHLQYSKTQFYIYKFSWCYMYLSTFNRCIDRQRNCQLIFTSFRPTTIHTV